MEDKKELKLASLIHITQDGVVIDGVELPWYVSAEGITTTWATGGALPVVHLPIFAEQVIIEDTLRGKDG